MPDTFAHLHTYTFESLSVRVHLYVCVQWLAQLGPLSVQLDQTVDVAALGRLLQAEAQCYSGAVCPSDKMNVLIFGQYEVFTPRPAHSKHKVLADLL